MDNRTVGIAMIVLAVLGLTVAQLVIKARLGFHGVVPLRVDRLPQYIGGLLLDLSMWGAGLLLVAGAFCWYAGVSRLPLSVAFPFAALSYPLVFAGSLLFLRDTFVWQTLGGNVLIVAGLLLVASGYKGA